MCVDNRKDSLTRDQALTMFKMYEDKGWAVKQQMLAIFSFLTPVIFGLIGFCATDYFSKKALTPTTTVAAWTAFSLSLFMICLIVLSLLHANGDYIRSRRVLKHARTNELLPLEIFKIIPNEVAEILNEEVKPDSSLWLRLSELCHRLWQKGFGYIGWQFMAIMGFALLLGLISLLVALEVTLSSGLSPHNSSVAE